MMKGLPISSWATTAFSSEIWEGTPFDMMQMCKVYKRQSKDFQVSWRGSAKFQLWPHSHSELSPPSSKFADWSIQERLALRLRRKRRSFERWIMAEIDRLLAKESSLFNTVPSTRPFVSWHKLTRLRTEKSTVSWPHSSSIPTAY